MVTGKLIDIAPFDRAHYQLDNNIVGFAALLDGPPDSSAIARAMDEYVASCPKLRWRPVMPGATSWQQVDGFSGSDNLRIHKTDESLTARHLFDIYLGYRDIASRERPPWRVIVVETADGGIAPAAILMLCHHSVGDGFRMSHFLFSLQGINDRAQSGGKPPQTPAVPPLKRFLAHTIAWLAFGISAIDALVRSALGDTKGPQRDCAIFHARIQRHELRKFARQWQCSNETACYMFAARFLDALNINPKQKRRIVVPLVFQRTTYMATFGNRLIPFEFTFKGNLDANKAKRIDRWRARIHSWLTPFGLKICENYILAGLKLASLLPASVVQSMRHGWALRFSASCTVVPFPARGFYIGGAGVDEVMCFTPQLSENAPAITFTTYRSTVSVIVRFPAAMNDAPARLQAVLDHALNMRPSGS